MNRMIRKPFGIGVPVSLFFVMCTFSCAIERLPDVITLDSTVTVLNTYQSPAAIDMGGTGGAEIAVETFLGVPDGSLIESASVSNTEVEFPNYLGRWDIEINPNSIDFFNVSDEQNPPFPGYHRVLGADTFDRFYLTFSQPLQGGSAAVNRPNVAIAPLSTNGLLITFSEGFDTRVPGFQIVFLD